MSHLGDQLSALIDGELGGTELDRANAHLAACGHCQGEAAALRRLKFELRTLGADPTDAGQFTELLLAMPIAQQEGGAGRNPGGPTRRQPRSRRRSRARAVSRRGSPEPYTARSWRGLGRRPVRYVLWSTLSLVIVGVGGAAFGMGGGGSPSGPRITPQLEVFDLQHAITSGDLPYTDPAISARVPVGASAP
jgi:anti-sigma factor RsiW